MKFMLSLEDDLCSIRSILTDRPLCRPNEKTLCSLCLCGKILLDKDAIPRECELTIYTNGLYSIQIKMCAYDIHAI